MTVTIGTIQEVYKGWSRVLKVTLSDGSATFHREVEDHGVAAAVLPYDPERRVALLVRMPRTPVLMSGERDLFEAPAGLVDDGEGEEACVRREALEEAGVTLRSLEFVSRIWSCPGVSTERIALFLAPYALKDRTGAGGGLADENENITVAEMSLAELARLTDQGNVTDLKTLALVQTLRLRRPDLF